MHRMLFALLVGTFATGAFAQVATPSTAVNPNTNPAAVGVPTTPPSQAQMNGEQRKEQRLSQSPQPVPRTADTAGVVNPQTNPAAVGVPSNPPTRAQVTSERRKVERMSTAHKKPMRKGTPEAARQKNLQGG